ADARRLGIADSTLSDGVVAGRFRRAAPAVFVVGGCPSTGEQRLTIAVLSMPGLVAVSHRAAAEMWGLVTGEARHLEVVTTRWDRVPQTGVTIHESLDLVAADIKTLDGLPITTPARTVVDLGATSPWAVEGALETGIRRQLLTLKDVEAFVARVARRGRRGVGVIRPLLVARRKWDTITESVLEDRFRETLHEAGLPEPQPQYTVRGHGGRFVCRADFAYPTEHILIELDSEAHHMDRLTFRRDRSKQNSAVVLGWTVLRFTWWDLEEDPLRVTTQVQAALDALSRPKTRQPSATLSA
ncbi:MAG: DUF559 domain-containing protein, partial [Acidimicrobiia bacterium]